jgi:NAD(P)-dependent dehydrogenase (short-subunit alcohol dehydrogenase family)
VGNSLLNCRSARIRAGRTVLAYGGVDGVVVTAAVSLPTDSSVHLPDEKWEATLRINVMGSYCVADEVTSILREQGLSASVVLTSSANA